MRYLYKIEIQFRIRHINLESKIWLCVWNKDAAGTVCANLILNFNTLTAYYLVIMLELSLKNAVQRSHAAWKTVLLKWLNRILPTFSECLKLIKEQEDCNSFSVCWFMAFFSSGKHWLSQSQRDWASLNLLWCFHTLCTLSQHSCVRVYKCSYPCIYVLCVCKS